MNWKARRKKALSPRMREMLDIMSANQCDRWTYAEEVWGLFAHLKRARGTFDALKRRGLVAEKWSHKKGEESQYLVGGFCVRLTDDGFFA